MPFTELRTCMRVNAIMDVSVPISGLNPGFGPMTHGEDSCACTVEASKLPPGAMMAQAAPNFRNVRRSGRHSTGNSIVIDHSKSGV